MKELRDIFSNVKEQGDLDKRLLQVFEMGVRAGAEKMASWNYAEIYDDPVQEVTELVMEKFRPWEKP